LLDFIKSIKSANAIMSNVKIGNLI